MDKMTNEKVEKLAQSIRIALSDDDVKKMTEEINKTINAVEKIQELNTSDVKPTTHGIVLENIMREDKPQHSITQEEALANAPDQQDGHFKVPSIME